MGIDYLFIQTEHDKRLKKKDSFPMRKLSCKLYQQFHVKITNIFLIIKYYEIKVIANQASSRDNNWWHEFVENLTPTLTQKLRGLLGSHIWVWLWGWIWSLLLFTVMNPSNPSFGSWKNGHKGKGWKADVAKKGRGM